MPKTSKATRSSRRDVARKKTSSVSRPAVHVNGDNRIVLSASSIVRVLKLYNRPVSIELVAAKLNVNNDQMRVKMADLQRDHIVTINGNAVKLDFD